MKTYRLLCLFCLFSTKNTYVKARENHAQFSKIFLKFTYLFQQIKFIIFNQLHPLYYQLKHLDYIFKSCIAY